MCIRDRDQLDLPEIEIDSRIGLPDGKADEIEQIKATAEKADKAPGDKRPKLPASGSELVAAKDSDSDGKLTQDEIGSPFSNFFSRIDADGDGFVTAAEADTQLKRMQARSKNGGGRNGAGQAGRGGPSGPSGVGRPGGVSQ